VSRWSGAMFAILATVPPTLPAGPPDGGFLSLFDGESLYGWTAEPGYTAGEGILRAPAAGGEARHHAAFGDFTLTLELRWTARKKVEVRAAACVFRSADYRSRNGWRVLQIVAAGDSCSVRLDSAPPKSGRRTVRSGGMSLVANGPGEAQFRNLRLRPEGLRDLFDGATLTGWKAIVSPNAQYGKAVWSVVEGAIHVDPGQGALESAGLFRNFVARVAVRTEPRPGGPIPNSGVFLRGAPGVFWSGYEVQIRNTPVDKFGTGGLYNIQRARTIVPKDAQWFDLTVSVCNRHIAVWVDGVPVNDWEDPNPAGDSVRNKLAMLAPGTIVLQAHDPGSPMSFRSIRVGELACAGTGAR
jgi:hypothetical protein